MGKTLEGLNREQREAVTTTEGSLLIIAGAGTGKTTVITRRIAYLIEQKLAKPSEVLALTFTEKAAGEMEERVDILVPYGYIDTWISTFHAFGNRVLQGNALDMGLPPDFKVMTRAAQILFFQQNLFAFDLNYYRPLSNPTKFIEAILSFISRCKDEDISPEDYKKYVDKLKKLKPAKLEMTKEEWKSEIKRQEELARVYEKYEDLKSGAGLLDFGDQVAMTLRLFRTRPKVLKSFQERFKYILVDEFQDTNWSQNELVKLLAKPKDNICVVADDDQSIYRFRGAAVSNVLEFRKKYPRAKVVTLIENYRSTQPILDSAYKLIQQNNPDRLEIKEKINKKLLAVRKEKGAAPKEVFAETLGEEADLVANEIENLVGKRNQKSLQYKDIAILVRANSQADPFLRALNMKGIPSKFVGSQGLYERPEIRILIAFLNSIANLEDSLQLFTLATSELYEMPMEDAISAASFANRRGKSLHWVFSKIDELNEEIEISKKGKEIIEGIRKDLSAARELARKENAGKVLFEFLNKVGYLSALEQEGSVEAEIKIQSIARFFDRIREFLDLASNNSIRSFIEWLEVMRSVGDDPRTSEFDPEIDAVNVMTIHSAKGLEFRAVFLVSLVSDQFPSRQRSEAIPLPDPLIKETLPTGDFHTQEERRLFYVGATRAQDHLYFTWSRDMGGKRIKKVSPFVLESLDKTISESLVSKLSPMQRISLFESNGDELVVTKTEPKIIKLSQAAIDDYETCAYKYRYVHVLRLPILRHHTVVYGSALHQAVAAFYRNKMQKQKMPLAELFNVFENAWISEGFLSAEHEEKRLAAGKKVLEEFWNREKDSKELPTYIEKEFRFSLGDTLVRGRFDRVDVKDGEVKIIDFKSTENRDQERLDKDAKESIQLKVYALAYVKDYKVVPGFVGIYDLESGLVAGYKPTKEMLIETEKEVIEAAQNIRKNLKEDKFPAKPKYFGRVPACTYCAYNSICPFSISRR
jgi:DNA helicase-2/ATP-dependent DNA helicase PcrA